jgi:hypothetical protein
MRADRGITEVMPRDGSRVETVQVVEVNCGGGEKGWKRGEKRLDGYRAREGCRKKERERVCGIGRNGHEAVGCGGLYRPNPLTHRRCRTDHAPQPNQDLLLAQVFSR